MVSHSARRGTDLNVSIAFGVERVGYLYALLVVGATELGSDVEDVGWLTLVDTANKEQHGSEYVEEFV